MLLLFLCLNQKIQAVNIFKLKNIKNSTSSTRLPNLDTKYVNFNSGGPKQTWHQNE